MVDRFAALLQTRDIQSGDFVGVFMTNSPEMVITLYALSKLGAVAAMINTNLRGMLYTILAQLRSLTLFTDDTFIHCLNVSGSKFIISTHDLSQHVCSDLPI